MRNSKSIICYITLSVAVLITSYIPFKTWAHCDSLGGPVIKDARIALETGNVNQVLKWITKEKENEIIDVFKQAMSVRKKGGGAKDLADRYFFETLVRIHRAGEGEAYTGLKPAGSVDPGIEAADKALESGSVNALASHLTETIDEGIQRRFKLVQDRRIQAEDSVNAGREYVEAYVDFIHYVEQINLLVTQGVSHLHNEPATGIE